MLRSCLPRLDVTAYDAWLKTRMTPFHLALARKTRMLPTGTIVCNAQTW